MYISKKPHLYCSVIRNHCTLIGKKMVIHCMCLVSFESSLEKKMGTGTEVY